MPVILQRHEDLDNFAKSFYSYIGCKNILLTNGYRPVPLLILYSCAMFTHQIKQIPISYLSERNLQFIAIHNTVNISKIFNKK